MNFNNTLSNRVKLLKRSCILLLWCSLLLTSLDAEDLGKVKWKKINVKNEIEVFRQSNPSERIVALRGKTIIDAPLEKIISILLEPDLERRKGWFENLIEYNLVKQPSPLKRILHITVDIPWPLKERDFVYSAVLTTYPKEKKVTLVYNSLENIVPEQDKIVRGKMESIFILQSLEYGEKTLVDARTLVDPKGKISANLVNFVQKNFAYDMLLNLRNLSDNPEILVLAEFQDIVDADDKK